MRLEKITLENFRNYKKTEIILDSDLVLIVGENASGKTNFLESIYYLSNLKSFRSPDQHLVQHSEQHFSIKGEVTGESLEVVVQKEPMMRRVFKSNGQKIKRIAWKTFQTVLFVPTDLNMFILGPDARRKFLNEVLVEKEGLYSLDLQSLDHILKQRGALLHKIKEKQAHPLELDFWNQELARVAIRITRSRRNFLDFVNDRFNAIYKNLTNFKTEFQIIYKGLEENISEAGFIQKLNDHLDAEVGSGMNLIGPHRDDFTIMKDGVQNIYNSSRGELREQILTLKILQADYIKVGEDKPIILLDDVFSELDYSRRLKLLENINDNQVVITSTEEHFIKNSRLIRVKDNSLVLA
ncbi:MAG TPA: DNA replication and repair protein RecF [Verrucomicrobiae bacterium]|nr:DNA replication and repair protein RecF [Verrucomicrobiae bacterium]